MVKLKQLNLAQIKNELNKREMFNKGSKNDLLVILENVLLKEENDPAKNDDFDVTKDEDSKMDLISSNDRLENSTARFNVPVSVLNDFVLTGKNKLSDKKFVPLFTQCNINKVNERQQMKYVSNFYDRCLKMGQSLSFNDFLYNKDFSLTYSSTSSHNLSIDYLNVNKKNCGSKSLVPVGSNDNKCIENELSIGSTELQNIKIEMQELKILVVAVLKENSILKDENLELKQNIDQVNRELNDFKQLCEQSLFEVCEHFMEKTNNLDQQLFNLDTENDILECKLDSLCDFFNVESYHSNQNKSSKINKINQDLNDRVDILTCDVKDLINDIECLNQLANTNKTNIIDAESYMKKMNKQIHVISSLFLNMTGNLNSLKMSLNNDNNRDGKMADFINETISPFFTKEELGVTKSPLKAISTESSKLTSIHNNTEILLTKSLRRRPMEGNGHEKYGDVFSKLFYLKISNLSIDKNISIEEIKCKIGRDINGSFGSHYEGCTIINNVHISRLSFNDGKVAHLEAVIGFDVPLSLNYLCNLITYDNWFIDLVFDRRH